MSTAPKPTLSAEELAALRARVAERAKHMSPEDLTAILEGEAKAETKMAALTASLPGFVKQVRLGYAMVRDYVKGDYRELPWWSVASVAAALGYFLAPTDFIPDFIPLLGYVDDAAVLGAVMAAIREDLKRYGRAKGLDLE